MNYKYKMIDAEYVLTEQEHTYCVDQFKKGKSIILLREGKLGINMNFLKSWNETDHKTDSQEQQVLKLPSAFLPEGSLDDGRRRAQGFIKISHDDFFAKMGWKHKEDCLCKIK